MSSDNNAMGENQGKMTQIHSAVDLTTPRKN
jgi:hypothetical protein